MIMLTVVSASIAEGYSGMDHLITGRECSEIIGDRYSTIQLALRAAKNAAKRNADSRVICGQPTCYVRVADKAGKESDIRG
jgi:hypothetical protein